VLIGQKSGKQNTLLVNQTRPPLLRSGVGRRACPPVAFLPGAVKRVIKKTIKRLIY